jgi:hypothetical protein
MLCRVRVLCAWVVTQLLRGVASSFSNWGWTTLASQVCSRPTVSALLRRAGLYYDACACSHSPNRMYLAIAQGDERLWELALLNASYGLLVGSNDVVSRTIDGGLSWLPGTSLPYPAASTPPPTSGLTHAASTAAQLPSPLPCAALLQLSLNNSECVPNHHPPRTTTAHTVYLAYRLERTQRTRLLRLNTRGGCGAGSTGTGSRHHWYGAAWCDGGGGDGWVVGAYAATAHTTDGGVQWSTRSHPDYTALALYSVSCNVDGTAVAVGTDGLVLRVAAGNAPAWQSVAVPTSQHLHAVAFVTPQLVLPHPRLPLRSNSHQTNQYPRPLVPQRAALTEFDSLPTRPRHGTTLFWDSSSCRDAAPTHALTECLHTHTGDGGGCAGLHHAA